MRGRLLSASCETSWTIFALALEGSATNHFARRSLPVAKFGLGLNGLECSTHLASTQGEHSLLPFPGS